MKHDKSFLYKLPLFAVFCMSANSIADDTEIFFDLVQTADPDAYKPNVLFILDTSGSMTTNITTVSLATTYDPSTSYGSSPDTNIYGYTEDLSSFTTVLKTEVSCQAMLDKIDVSAATFDANNPTYTGKTASYSSYWNDWSAFGWWSGGREDYLECEEDEGVHGQTDATNPYTAITGGITLHSTGNYYNGVPTSPYSSSAGSSIDWSLMQTNTFVSANYHDFLQSNLLTSTDTRSNVMKAAAINLVNNFTGLNLGLMRFDGNNGGYVLHHFSNIETDSASIIASINALNASGNTPLAETLWEANRYFEGSSVDYGTNSNRDPAAVSSGNYNTPMSGNTAVDCQSNYVVYLTDGQPTSDSGRDTQISALGQGTCSHTGGTTADSSCLDEMSAYMASHDYNNVLDGVQSVKTYTIGFNIDLPLLEATATGRTASNKGGYFTANNSAELNDAFTQILTEIEQTSTTFVAPAVSVNAFNSLQHRNEVYYALFEPNVFPRWRGNIKKYKINSNGAILDQGLAPDNAPIPSTLKKDDIIDDTTGYFDDNALSFWTEAADLPVDADGADGANASYGGAASKLTTTRTVYTVAGDASLSNISLKTEDNTVSSDLSKTAISNLLYGIDESLYSSQAEIDTVRQGLTSWILGVDVKDLDGDGDVTEASHFISDPLHSRPSVVTYSGTQSDPNDSSTQVLDDTLFSMDNAGAFRAINAKTGIELFAFIPQQLLSNHKTYYDNDPNGTRVYGLDGPLTIWRQESTDEDINIESSDGDHVYAYFGMRRGGNNYYAMDVTDRNNPKLMWTILGGVTTGFSDLAQTWSRPILRKVNWKCDTNGDNCETKQVLFFTGGYDTVHDTATAASDTTGAKGGAIYMVDAETGSLLWSAGDNSTSSDTHDLHLPLGNSIPGDLTVADMDGDEAPDILFATDILGHVWRINFDDENQASNFANIAQNPSGKGEIANLTDGSQFRRFYIGPTVSLSQKRGRPPFFVLTMGTGLLAHPIDNTVEDRLYALFEYNVFGPPKDSNGDITYTAIDNSALFNMTSSASGPADPQGNAPYGFYKDATADGEKFLRRALTQQGFTIYTSYIPKGVAVTTSNSSCGAAELGTSRLFAMNFVTGVSAYTGEYINLNHPGISADPVTLFIEDEDTGTTETILCLGTECFNPDDEQNPFGEVTTQILYWRENTQ